MGSPLSRAVYQAEKLMSEIELNARIDVLLIDKKRIAFFNAIRFRFNDCFTHISTFSTAKVKIHLLFTRLGENSPSYQHSFFISSYDNCRKGANNDAKNQAIGAKNFSLKHKTRSCVRDDTTAGLFYFSGR